MNTLEQYEARIDRAFIAFAALAAFAQEHEMANLYEDTGGIMSWLADASDSSSNRRLSQQPKAPRRLAPYIVPF